MIIVIPKEVKSKIELPAAPLLTKSYRESSLEIVHYDQNPIIVPSKGHILAASYRIGLGIMPRYRLPDSFSRLMIETEKMEKQNTTKETG